MDQKMAHRHGPQSMSMPIQITVNLLDLRELCPWDNELIRVESANKQW